MAICIKLQLGDKYGKLKFNNEEDLFSFIKNHPTYARQTESLVLNEKPYLKNIHYVPNGVTGFKLTLDNYKDLSYAEGGEQSVDTLISLNDPDLNNIFSNASGFYNYRVIFDAKVPEGHKGVTLHDKKVILIADKKEDALGRDTLRHELIHLGMDKFSDTFSHIIVSDIIKNLGNSNIAKKIKDSENLIAEFMAYYYSSEQFRNSVDPKLFENNPEFYEALTQADVAKMLETAKDKKIDPPQESSSKVSFDETRFSDDSFEFFDEQELHTLDDMDAVTEKVWEDFEEAKKFKGYEIVDGTSTSDTLSLQQRNLKSDFSFGLDIAYSRTFDKVPKDNKDEAYNPERDLSHEEVMKELNDALYADWSVSKLPLLKQGDLVKVIMQNSDGTIMRDSKTGRPVEKFYPVVYNGVRKGKVTVATNYEGKKSWNKGKKVRLSILYSEIIGIREFRGLPKQELTVGETKSAFFDYNSKIVDETIKDFVIKQPDHVEFYNLSLAAEKLTFEQRMQVVDRYVKQGSLIRVRWKISDDIVKEKEYQSNYFTRWHKVIGVHGNSLTVAMNTKDDRKVSMLVPMSKVDRVSINKNDIKPPELESKKIKWEGKTIEVWNPKVDSTNSSVIGHQINSIKALRKDPENDELRKAAVEATDSIMENDWIKYIRGDKKYWGKVIVKYSNGDFEVITPAKDNDKSFSQRVLLEHLEFAMHDLESDYKVLKDQEKYNESVKEKYISEKFLSEAQGEYDHNFYEKIFVSDYEGKYRDEQGALGGLLKNIALGDRLKLKYKDEDGKIKSYTVTVTHKDDKGGIYYTTQKKKEDIVKGYRFKVNPENILEVHYTKDWSLHPSQQNLERVNYFEENKKILKILSEEKEKNRELKEDVEANASDMGIEIKNLEGFKSLMENDWFPKTFKMIGGKPYMAWKSKGEPLISALQNNYVRIPKSSKAKIALSEGLKSLRKGDYIAVKYNNGEAKYPVRSVTKYEDNNGKLTYKIGLIKKGGKVDFYNSDIYLREDNKGEFKAYKLSNKKLVPDANLIALGLKGNNRWKEFVGYDSEKKEKTYGQYQKRKVTLGKNIRSSRGSSKAANVKLLGKLIANLNNIEGINARMVTTGEIKALLEKAGKHYRNDRAIVDENGNIYIDKDKASLGDAMHEFSHVIMRVIENANPELYNQIINAATESDNFELMKIKYPDMSDRDIAEEVFTGLVGEAYDNKNTSWYQKFKNTIVNFVEELRNAIGSIFGYTPSRFLNEKFLLNNTIYDLANVFATTDIKRIAQEAKYLEEEEYSNLEVEVSENASPELKRIMNNLSKRKICYGV